MDERKDWTGPGGTGTGWVCDTCQQPINTAGDGWLDWIRDSRIGPAGKEEFYAQDVMIIHQIKASPLRVLFPKEGCSIHEIRVRAKRHGRVAGGHLEDFVGDEGLEILQELTSSELGAEEKFRTAIRRLHEPGYEQVYVDSIRAESTEVGKMNGRATA